MSVYDLHFNKDDVAIRNILIGLLATLSDNIGWYNQTGSKIDDRRKIDVPFYFSTTGTERYLQDNFLNNIDFDPDNLKAEAWYNQIPRGIVNFESFNIETQAIVNKYVRMQHLVQEQDGTLNTYNTEAFMVPIIMDVKVEIALDSVLDQLKCSEAIIRTFYKAKAYQVDIAYTRIPCLIIFPDDYAQERAVEFSFDDKKEFKVTFSLQVKSHIPVFKPETTIFAGTNMGSFQSNTFLPPLIMGPSGGGPSALLGNVPGSDPATGTTGGSNVVGYNPNPTVAGQDIPPAPTPQPGVTGSTGSTGGSIPPAPYNQPTPSAPFWPISPSTEFPPSA